MTMFLFSNRNRSEALQESHENTAKAQNLEVANKKTKLFEFGVFAQTKAKARGERPVTFDFLGFTHYNSRSRDGTAFS